ncbi:MAG: allantoinase AllB [Candidatus Bathyarchaeia archaeon]
MKPVRGLLELVVDLVVERGTIATPHGSFEGAIAIDHGKIVAIGSSTVMPQAKRSVDASGLFVLPGIIDGHCHFREPGFEYKEDLHTGSTSAAFGGVTTIFDMPNVNPPTQDAQSFNLKLEKAKQKCLVDFGIYGVVLPTNIDKIGELAKSGAIGFKIFMAETVGNLPSPDDWELVLAFEAIAKTGLRVGVHAENRAMINHLVDQFKKAGRTDALAHLESRPAISEAEAITRAVTLTRPFGTKLHIFHLSSAEGVAIVREAKEAGLPVTAETCPHYLLLDGKTEMQKQGAILKINPPVRTHEHGEALWRGLKSGVVDMIATDHSPQTKEEKAHSNIWEEIAGWPGVETLVPLMLNEVNKGTITLNEVAKYMSENPARVWGVYPTKGCLTVGSDGDLTIVDLKIKREIRAEDLHSKNKPPTPFEGWAVRGAPVYTIVGGRVVMEKGQLNEKSGRGKLVTPTAEKTKQ